MFQKLFLNSKVCQNRPTGGFDKMQLLASIATWSHDRSHVDVEHLVMEHQRC